nr:hypothetical protein [Tanacetum cinerariifolium]
MLCEWRVRKKGSKADPYGDYGAFPTVFCLKINHGGAFTPPPKIRYKGGKEPKNDLDNGLKKLRKEMLRDNDEDVIEDVSEDEWLQKSLRLVGIKKKHAVENDNVRGQSSRNESMNVDDDRDDGSNSDDGSTSDDDSDSQDSDFLVDPDNMINDVDMDMAEFRSNIDANVEWVGAKKMAQERVEGNHIRQYAQLRDYCLELKNNNPNTTIKIKVEPPEDINSTERKFKRVYVCLGPLKDGFKACKRDLLGLDECFLSGSYPGWILTAVGVDPNNGIYPLAYAIVESEIKDSWKRFLECVRDDLDLFRNSNFTFISDRQKGIIPAIVESFSSAKHRFCLKHIYDNMKLSWRGRLYKDMLWRCAASTTIKRDKPIITCLEFIREYLMKRIVNVQKVISKSDGPLTPNVTKVFNIIMKEAGQMKVDLFYIKLITLQLTKTICVLRLIEYGCMIIKTRVNAKSLSEDLISKEILGNLLFFGEFGQEGQKRDAFYQSKADIAPMLLRSTYRGIERNDPGPEQVGLGYRAATQKKRKKGDVELAEGMVKGN